MRHVSPTLQTRCHPGGRCAPSRGRGGPGTGRGDDGGTRRHRRRHAAATPARGQPPHQAAPTSLPPTPTRLGMLQVREGPPLGCRGSVALADKKNKQRSPTKEPRDGDGRCSGKRPAAARCGRACRRGAGTSLRLCQGPSPLPALAKGSARRHRRCRHPPETSQRYHHAVGRASLRRLAGGGGSPPAVRSPPRPRQPRDTYHHPCSSHPPNNPFVLQGWSTAGKHRAW